MTYPCTFQSFCFEAVFMPEFINANNSKLDLKKRIALWGTQSKEDLLFTVI